MGFLPKTSLRSIYRNRGSERSTGQCSFSTVVSQNGPAGPSNRCWLFLPFQKHKKTPLATGRMLHGSLTCGGVHYDSKGCWEPRALPLPGKLEGRRQYHVTGGTAHVGVTVTDWKDAVHDSDHIPFQLTCLCCAENRWTPENGSVFP